MKATTRIAVASLITLALVASLAACTRVSGSGAANVELSCSQLLAAAVQYERSGVGDIDAVMQALSDGCSDEYEIVVDYVSNSSDSAFAIDSCDELLGYGVRAESVALLEQDGRCSFGPGEAPVGPGWPEGGLGWDAAWEHAGTVQRVCGPLMSARETDDGTFLNVGQDYPSADRFTFIFWDSYLEPIAAGATLCGAGEVYLYDGVAQMEMWDPGALEIWR